ncbi:hypothetical protein BVX98_03590, partial [bacterium F11]
IRTVKGIDDFQSMAEDDGRRIHRWIKEKKQFPDLMLLDGGKGKRLPLKHIGRCRRIEGSRNREHAREIKKKKNQEEVWVRTNIVINAGGPFVDEIRKRVKGGGFNSLIDRVAGAHLDVYPAITKGSYYVTADDARLVFVLTRNEDGLEYSRIGTTERVIRMGQSSDNPIASEKEIQYLKSLVKEFFPSVNLSADTILRIDSGIRPLAKQESKSAFQKSREHQILEESGLYHVMGVKLTDFRRVAEELMRTIPWRKYELKRHNKRNISLAPLRSGSSSLLYEEETPKDILYRTMVIHWSDYYQRRRGLRPIVERKENPGKLKKQFEEMKQLKNFDDNEFEIGD